MARFIRLQMNDRGEMVAQATPTICVGYSRQFNTVSVYNADGSGTLESEIVPKDYALSAFIEKVAQIAQFTLITTN